MKYAYPRGGVTARIFSELPQVLISLSCKISKQKHSSMYFKLIYFLGQNVFLEKYLSMIKRWEKLVPAQAQGPKGELGIIRLKKWFLGTRKCDG